MIIMFVGLMLVTWYSTLSQPQRLQSAVNAIHQITLIHSSWYTATGLLIWKDSGEHNAIRKVIIGKRIPFRTAWKHAMLSRPPVWFRCLQDRFLMFLSIQFKQQQQNSHLVSTNQSSIESIRQVTFPTTASSVVRFDCFLYLLVVRKRCLHWKWSVFCIV